MAGICKSSNVPYHGKTGLLGIAIEPELLNLVIKLTYREQESMTNISGQLIAQSQLPTLFIFKGGYAVENIGINTVNVLQGFEST